MALIVQKYGGTSVGSPVCIKNVAKRISEARELGNDLVVVVSAMGDTTDELVTLAYKVSDHPPSREMDMLLTAGERISMALLCMALADLGIEAVSLTGSQSGIITTDSHQRAKIKKILGDRIRSGLKDKKVVIVAGFQGVSESKEITTLGRGGSDTTAVAIAAHLHASSCEIYTDVDGVYSADPRFISNAKFISSISHDHMLELAQRGAGVLHPRSVELAKSYKVSLCVKNSRNQNPGTQVISSQELKGVKVEEIKVVGVTGDPSKVLLKIKWMRPSAQSCVWDFATQKGLSLLAPFFTENELHMFVEREYEGDWKSGLSKLVADGFLKSYEFLSDWMPVSVVGDRLCQDGTALSKVLEVLASNEILVTMGTSSSLALTFGVQVSKYQNAVKCLHEKLMPS